MSYRGRRKLDLALVVAGAVVAALIGLVAMAAGDGERIDGYWTSAVIDGDPTGGATARVVEVIDYDFGTSQRRGIFRDVPGLDPAAAIEVESPTAPDRFVIETGWIAGSTRIKIGDPNQTIGGRHRYRIGYPVDVGFDGGRVSWNAVGSDWPIGIGDIEIHLLAPVELTDLQCSKGALGSWDGCNATLVEPGHVVVEIDGVDSQEGVTVSALRGGALASTPTLPTEPTGVAVDPGARILLTMAVAALTALIGGLVASVVIRRAGKELVWAGAGADAAYGPVFGEGDYPVRRVDHDELDSLATTEFAPPRGIRAWQGGVLYFESTGKDQQVAWLLEQAIAGRIEIEGGAAKAGKDLTLRRTDGIANGSPFEADPDTAHVAALFGGRRTIKLGTYDKQFAAAWKRLGQDLDRWHRDSPLWDPQGDRRRNLVLGLGFLPLILGGLVLAGGAVMAARSGPAWLAPVAIGGLLGGVGWAMVLRSWELRVRTPEGSGLWILIESFRRFINGSDAQHVDAAAKQGRLLDYTAWAVALGEVDRWSKAVEQADLGATVAPQALYLTSVAPHLGSATVAAATAPSSSGGGGGGSVGGGGGGGGGGSW